MRLLLSLKPHQIPCTIPFAYTHALATVIYGFLNRTSHDYARFLHDQGYRSGTKRFKLFTFSQLLIRKRAITPQGLVVLSPQVAWQVSSPIREFVEHFAEGLLQLGALQLFSSKFTVERVEVVPAPTFADTMRLRCLSPIVAATAAARYLRALDPGLSEALRKNLREKFVLVHGREPRSHALSVEFDREYLRRVGEGIYRLVDYKGTQIKAIMAPFVVRGSAELIQIGYEAGFGEKNSMGFGMVEVINDARQKGSW